MYMHFSALGVHELFEIDNLAWHARTRIIAFYHSMHILGATDRLLGSVATVSWRCEYVRESVSP